MAEPAEWPRRAREFLGLPVAVLAVLSATSTVVWVVGLATAKHQRPLNSGLWSPRVGCCRGARLGASPAPGYVTEEVVHHHHYATGMTVNFESEGLAATGATGSAEDSTERDVVGPAQPPVGGRASVRLADYVEFPLDAPPVIRNKHFRNVVIQGPIVLAAGGASEVIWRHTQFGVPAEHKNAIFWLVDPDDAIKTGAAPHRKLRR